MIKVCEYVSFGHPDKIADQISDALVDEYLSQDPNSRCGIETMVKDNTVVIGGEVSSNAVVNHREVIRNVYDSIRFPENHNLTIDNLKIINLIGQQSQEIHNGVDKDEEIGAGDQGLMYGYATDETPDYMPLGTYIAKKICNYVATNFEDMFGPDVKTQVVIDYNDTNITIQSILVSTMHQCSIEYTRDLIKQIIIDNAMEIDDDIFSKYEIYNTEITVNPCGSWQIGGPISDCGVTGRKLVVDNYGSYCEIGGGAYSGKDMTKVDRSAAYMARYLAKNIVASGVAKTAKVSLSYMIGVAEPCSVCVETNNGKEIDDKLIEIIKQYVDLTPSGIIKRFHGTEPQYYNTARYGHYGNELFPWEQLDIVGLFK